MPFKASTRLTSRIFSNISSRSLLIRHILPVSTYLLSECVCRQEFPDRPSLVAGLSMHATILAYMFLQVEQGRIKVALGPSPDNVAYVQEFVASLLRTAFPHLTDNQVKITVQGLFNLDQDIPAFKEHLRDFLVQIRVS